MNDIVLTSDSGICAIKRENEKVIPIQISVNDSYSFTDDGKVSSKEIMDRMKMGERFKTSSPLLGDYDNTFRSILEEGKDVIHLSMSSGISAGSVNSANLIASNLNSEYPNKVYVIDSLTGATGGTLFHELAYEKIVNSNLSASEIVEKLNILKRQIMTSFYVPDIDGFIRSGRNKTALHLKESALSGVSYLAKMASLKFRVDFHSSGDLYLKKMFRSNKENGMKKMVNNIVNEDNIETFDPSLVVIGNLLPDKVNMGEIKKYLLSFNYFNNVIEEDIGRIVAPYGCNDLCGISLVRKR